MRAADLDLKELLDVDPERAIVRFAGQRVLILDTIAMGILRKELLESLGQTAARALLTRFGYAYGWRAAETLGTELPWDNEDEKCAGVRRIVSMRGLLRLERGDGETDCQPCKVDLRESYEAEQHLLHVGLSEYPVCWTLCGFLSGFMSRLQEEQVYFLEDRCVGRGDAACHAVGRTLEQWGNAADEQLPFFRKECLETSLGRITEALKKVEEQLGQRRRELTRTAGAVEDPSGLTVNSDAMRRVVDLARRVAKVESTVLVTGESGSGKERIARLIHDESARAAGPFVGINCAAVTETLLESELFGHARGAFTGATKDRPGLFEAASGGTLFLDEVGEIPISMQVKLLRVLQEREVRRVGENRSRRVDVRVVAATNRGLEKDVETGRFRKDLYYRLKVVELKVPPLRERREDILPLARVLLADAARRLSRHTDGLSPQAADQLLRYTWPGNVRELENAMERAVALDDGGRVDVEDLPEEVRAAPPEPVSPGSIRRLEDVERDYILSALAANGGNQTNLTNNPADDLNLFTGGVRF